MLALIRDELVHAISTIMPRKNSLFAMTLAPVLAVTVIVVADGQETGPAEASAAEVRTSNVTFSDAVVAKADKILDAHGLRRSGKSIQSSRVIDVSRAMSGLSRSKRDLKRVHVEWKAADDAVKLNRQHSALLNRQNGELNLQLARATDTASNNRWVGLINANIARQKILRDQLESLTKIAAQKRSELSVAEAAYAETVLAIREDLTSIADQVTESLSQKDVRTAIDVAHANFDVPLEQSAGIILKSVERRLGKIEQEIFSESIPLRVENRSLYVDVVVGGETTPMVVDSGASLVSLPAKTASELGIIVPDDAPQLRLIMADGREISGQRVTLAKVRIGNFEAENVDAAVLSATAELAEPLLGMSFLGNFKFEIDMASKSLKMLRVQAE
jgi:aspartyl protease family protein